MERSRLDIRIRTTLAQVIEYRDLEDSHGDEEVGESPLGLHIKQCLVSELDTEGHGQHHRSKGREESSQIRIERERCACDKDIGDLDDCQEKQRDDQQIHQLDSRRSLAQVVTLHCVDDFRQSGSRHSFSCYGWVWLETTMRQPRNNAYMINRRRIRLSAVRPQHVVYPHGFIRRILHSQT